MARCTDSFAKSFISATLLLLPALSIGQTSIPGEVLNSEGISGYADKHHRNPILSVQSIVDPTKVRILVDASILDSQLQKFPLKFDFYVNRTFVTSMIRSPDLTGAIGVEIAPTVATPPFNYSVVATLLHPNRQFTSVVNAAVFPTNLTSKLECVLTVNDDSSEVAKSVSTVAESEASESDEATDASTIEYTAPEVTTQQVDNSTFKIEFNEAPGDTEGKTASLVAAVLVGADKKTASSLLSFTTENGEEKVQTTGEVMIAEGALKELSLASSDEGVTLSCK